MFSSWLNIVWDFPLLQNLLVSVAPGVVTLSKTLTPSQETAKDNISRASNEAYQNSSSTVQFHCLDPLEHLSRGRGMPPRLFSVCRPIGLLRFNKQTKVLFVCSENNQPAWGPFFDQRGLILAPVTSLQGAVSDQFVFVSSAGCSALKVQTGVLSNYVLNTFFREKLHYEYAPVDGKAYIGVQRKDVSSAVSSNSWYFFCFPTCPFVFQLLISCSPRLSFLIWL